MPERSFVPSRGLVASLAVIALPLALALWASFAGETFYVTLATRIAILGLAATGLNLALGLGGLVSLGHAAFFGIGGYVAGIVASHAMEGTSVLGLPAISEMAYVWLLAAVAAGLFALVMGAISLRTSGVAFIMITLAFAQMIFYLAIAWPGYGGEDGLPITLRNGFFGLRTMRPMPFFLISFGALLFGLALFAVLKASRFGAALQAARQNGVRLASLGVEPFRIRLVAFVLSGMITALAGALYADLNRFVSPSMLSWHMSGELIVLVVLGGVGRLAGPLAGATLYVLLEHVLGGLTERWQFFLGLALLAVVLLGRGGLMSLLAPKGVRHG
ncbi:branched-chain amino acid ABC transporter permease [Antarcticirhabdus aurantiaca]|uniref:Branched-chain amino acid ABC transporter permease n=1 Tax=Antarcticirhabdus aurantiaca TaxID=2606717 RepID=A0ACD4NM15_9HYPH|nr:branched-chain amino acid ABC transporter permease [Antarcticirhabdus aurantiaca]WAJ27912.1 branched-chain amino acid ABC transporter permease [Jeongeuplla avenae]